jgi:DNA-binding NarL/FixJ family response regulator
MRRVRLLLLGDQGLAVRALGSLLHWHYDVVGTARDGQELVEALPCSRPDVIVADVDSVGVSFHDALGLLKGIDRKDAKIVVLTMHGDPELAEEAFRAGGSGYVLKHSAAFELHTAIQEVLQGRSYLASHITNRLFAALASSGARPADLTASQRDVLRLSAQGRRVPDIAAILDVPAPAVAAARDEMMDELDLESVEDLSRYAIEHGLAVH